MRSICRRSFTIISVSVASNGRRDLNTGGIGEKFPHLVTVDTIGRIPNFRSTRVANRAPFIREA